MVWTLATGAHCAIYSSNDPWSLGAGGATVALPADFNLSIHNPAALARLDRAGLDTAVFFDASGLNALPVYRASAAHLGGWSLAFAGGTADAASALSLGWALPLGESAALGLNQDYDFPGRTYGAGLGWQQSWILPAGLPGRLRAGASARGLAASDQPDLAAGLAWTPEMDSHHGGWVTAQLGREAGSLRARMGIQAPLAWGLSVMTGASGGEAAPFLAHGGLNWRWAGSVGWEMVYALSSPAGGWDPAQSGASSQSFALRMAWGQGRPRAPKAELLRLFRDSKDDGVLLARLGLSDIALPGAWSLDLLSEEGAVQARFSGDKLPPAALSWNGEDLKGRRSRASRWLYESRLRLKNGRELKRGGRLEAARPASQAEAGQAQAEAEDAYGWQSAPHAGLRRAGPKPIIQLSTFQDLEGMERESTEEWKLVITGSGGEFTRTFKGKGLIPSSLAWDGLDDEGLPAASDGLRYTLRLTTKSGKRLERRSVLAQLAAPAGAQGLLETGGGDLYSLRAPSGTPAEAGGRRRVKAGLRRDKSLSVAAASFDFSDQGHSRGQWQLRVVDSKGRTVRTLKGWGKPPRGLRWDGKNDSGKMAMLDLGAGYEMRVSGADGKARQWKDDLVAQRDFERFAGQAKVLAQLSEQTTCVLDDEPGCLRCTVHFPFGKDEPDAGGEAEMREIRRLITGARLSEVRIEGHADSLGEGETNFRISQARADALLEFLLDKLGIQANLALALGQGDSRPLDKGRSEAARARNRRAEVLVKF